MPHAPDAARSSIWPGLSLASAVAAVAWIAGGVWPLVGPAIFALALGVLAGWLLRPGPASAPGIRIGGRSILQASIVVLGFGLDLGEIARVGLETMGVMLGSLAIALLAAWLIGRWLRVSGKLTVLVGVGTAICGGSAIAAVVPILRPDDTETAFAISTIFLFNLLAVLVFPPLGHALGLSDAGFGLWAGTAINDTSSVVAAGYAYSREAGDYATIVKLTRATMIIPLCLALAVAMGRRRGGAGGQAGAGATGGAALLRGAPWFIAWFLVASGLRTSGVVPAAALAPLHTLAMLLMCLALAAIGLSADLRRMAATGPRPVLLGLCVWAVVAVCSLLLQTAFGQG